MKTGKYYLASDSGDSVEKPRNKHVPAWDNRAHVVNSMHNHKFHTQYKEFFDKKKGQQQYTDQFRYIYKTPSNGMRDYSFYDQRVK